MASLCGNGWELSCKYSPARLLHPLKRVDFDPDGKRNCTRCFIAGSVATKDNDECAEGAGVTLIKDPNIMVGGAVMNDYGDFIIDNLEENSGEYNLTIELAGYEKKELSVDLKASVNLGTIIF
jgi:hypothetical protein